MSTSHARAGALRYVHACMRIRLLPLTVFATLSYACGGEQAGDDEAAPASTSATSSSSAGSSNGPADSDEPPADPTTSTTGGGPTSADDSSGAPASTTTTTSSDDTGDATSDDTGTPSACPDSPLSAGDHDIVIDHPTGMRTAILHVPPGLDPNTPAPLIFNFHGFTMTAEGQVTFSGMNKLADEQGILVVYAQGLDNSWNAGACCGNAQTQGVDDVGFVRALHAHLAALVCYDARRVYATGMSNGGFIANRLACEAADIFAAVGPVSAVNGMEICDPSRPIPVIAFNGTNDLLVAYDGLLYQSVADSFSEWGARNGCEGAPVPGTMNGSASCETYDSCADDVQVTQCTLEGMGHCWPGNPACVYGTPNTDLDANAEMWAFFQQFKLP